MKKHLVIILIGVLIVGLGFASVVSAQGRQTAAREMYMVSEESNLNGDDNFGLICSGEIIHPVLMNLEDSYGVNYEDLLPYFCEYRFGVGEIRLALRTAEREGVELEFDEILELRLENGMEQIGWGLIWQELGLIGRGRQNNESENQNDDLNGGVVCAGEMEHPVLLRLAETFDVEYDELELYFCEYGFGIGEIRHALNTAENEAVDETYDEILEMRLEDGTKEVGWGQIWQDLGLIGSERNDRGEEMGQEGRNNKPEVPPGLGGPHPGRGRGPNK